MEPLVTATALLSLAVWLYLLLLRGGFWHADARLGAEERLILVPARPPDPGWTGKTWALSEGLNEAHRRALDAAYIWLSDADIAHGATGAAAVGPGRDESSPAPWKTLASAARLGPDPLGTTGMTRTASGEEAAAMTPELHDGDFGRAAETPSGKSASDENFPVGSWLLPARLRPHVAKFYAFARAIDDIADNPELTPEDKIRRLDRFEDAITGREYEDPALATAHRLRSSLAETGVTERHCVDLVAAFKQDAVKLRYGDWDELLGYCELSANPVGRYLLDLHGEDPAGHAESDALCSALQVVNHLQDCADDYRNLDRVYLPQDWMTASGVTVAALSEPASSVGLRRVLDLCLDATAALLERADRLPGRLRSRHLALESAVIVSLAHRLVCELRDRDPLAERVVLTKAQTLGVAVPSALAEFTRRTFARPSRRMEP